MFDLEAQIKEWRAELARTGIAREVVDELENHLREDFRRQVSAGKTEERAFQLAVSRLGNPASIQTEFRKIRRPVVWPVRIGFALWLAVSLPSAAHFVKIVSFGSPGRILSAHRLAVTAGYTGAFVLAGFGIWYVWMTRSRELSPAHWKTLNRAAGVICRLAAGLVFAGMILAMLWSKRHWGVYWSWDPLEIGCLCVIAWLVGVATMQRLNLAGERVVMLLCIGGGIVVSFAWFGAQVFHRHQLGRGNGLGDYWLLAILLSIQSGFLAMSVLPAQKRTA